MRFTPQELLQTFPGSLEPQSDLRRIDDLNDSTQQKNTNPEA